LKLFETSHPGDERVESRGSYIFETLLSMSDLSLFYFIFFLYFTLCLFHRGGFGFSEGHDQLRLGVLKVRFPFASFVLLRSDILNLCPQILLPFANYLLSMGHNLSFE